MVADWTYEGLAAVFQNLDRQDKQPNCDALTRPVMETTLLCGHRKCHLLRETVNVSGIVAVDGSASQTPGTKRMASSVEKPSKANVGRCARMHMALSSALVLCDRVPVFGITDSDS